MASLGAEVFQADLSDTSSLSQAFTNANAIFVNTDFWGPFVAAKKANAAGEKTALEISETAFDTEVLYGKNAAHAAAAVPLLERFIYSALPPMKKHSKGKYSDTHHYDSKATVIEYILEDEPELAKKTSFIYLGAYNTNAMLTPRLDPASGRYTFILPMSRDLKLPIIDPKNSTGPFVRALIEDEDAGTKLLAYDSYLSMGEVSEMWAKASGKEAAYVEVSAEIMHLKFGVPKEVLDAPAYFAEYGFMGGVEDFIEPGQLKKEVKTKSIETWLNQRDWNEVLEAKPVLRSMEK